MTRAPGARAPLISRRAALLAALGGAGAVGACARLPRDGEVRQSDVVVAEGDSLVQSAAGPEVGASPKEIVEGFLRACAAGYSDGFATARSFLTKAAADSWRPQEIVMVYTGSESPVVEQAGEGAVDLRTRLIGSLDGAGILTPRDDEDHAVSYSLTADSTGQWRIAALPDGILLPEPVFGQEFSAYLLHFLSLDRERAVPELRWAALRTAAPALMRLLLGGPSDWLAPGADTLVPPGLRLLGGLDAPLPADGAVTVSVSSEAAALDPTGRALLVAQIERTLTQVAGIHSVSVRALGDEEDPRDADAGTALGGAADLDAAPGASGQAIGMSGGNVVRGLSTARETLATSRALGTTSARWPDVGADGTIVALAGRSMLLLAPGRSVASVIHSVDDESAGQTAGGDQAGGDQAGDGDQADGGDQAGAGQSGGGMTPPVIDRHGWTWTAARGEIVVLNRAGLRADLAAEWLVGSRVLALDVSAESERLVVRRLVDGETADRVEAAVIVRDARGLPQRLGPPLTVPGAGGTRALAWSDPVAVAVLADGGAGAPDVKQIQVGGTAATIPGLAGAVELTANRTDGLVLLTDSAGQIWHRNDGTWRVAATDLQDVGYCLA